MLRHHAPTALAAARTLAHRGVQWPARAAWANLAPAPDDSHTSLEWDAEMAALLGQPLAGGVRVGLRIGVYELVVTTKTRCDALALGGKPDAEVGAWLDGKLTGEGLKPASGVKLPYDMPPTLFARASEEAPHFAALSLWFAAAADVLEELTKKYRRYKPGPGPVRCWPHHFDIAFLVALEEGTAETARSIGVGVSPGDGYYAQPYFYLSPYPKPDTESLPALPPGGRWHTKDFFGAVATGIDLLALSDPREGLIEIADAAFAESLKRLGFSAARRGTRGK
jgi:hypothetical protein